MSEVLHVDQDEHGIVTLTMDDPKTRNALTGNAMVPEFLHAFERIQSDRAARVVIITGAGHVFSSGGNIAEMDRQRRPEFDSAMLRHEYREGIQRLPLGLHQLEVPVIAAVNGAAMGAGLDLACMCDMRIAAESARFAESFVKLGIVSGDGGAWFLPRLIGMAKAAEMTYTGDPIDASQALEWGLVSRIVPGAELMETARALALRIAANPPEAVRMSKRLLREGQTGRLDTVLEMAAGFQAIAHKTPEHEAAVRAFLEKRAPRR